MTALYLMLKYGHFTGTVRSGDMVSGLLNGNEKAKIFVIWKEIKNEEGTNEFVFCVGLSVFGFVWGRIG
jgi:hypothetical protein